MDVEMQSEERAGMPQRARLYSARLTKEAWASYVEDHGSYDYSKMPRGAVVFVCKSDPLGAGRRRYAGRMVYDGAPGEGDGVLVVLLNAGGSGGGLDPDLAAFLDYVASGRAEAGRSGFVDEVDRAVAAGNDDSDFLEGVMDIAEKLWISRQEGLEEGRAEGEAKGEAAGATDQKRKISELARRMAADDRQGDLVATLTDDSRLEEELRRYGIK